MTSPRPRFSIIVPTCDRRSAVERCLQALAQLDFDRDRFEVLVVDDGSPGDLQDLVARFESRLNVRLIRQANQGPASARNTGALAAEGDYLGFVDDDCCLARDWLSKMADQVTVERDVVVGGRTTNALTENIYATASQLLVSYIYEYYNPDPDNATFLTSNNLIVPTSMFHDVGGFDTRFRRAGAEDRDFCARWLEDGHRMRYLPEARVEHFHALTKASFWRQHFNYGRGAANYHRRRSRRAGVARKLEPSSFYVRLVLFPIKSGMKLKGLPLAGLLVVSQLATVAGYLMGLWKKDWKAACCLSPSDCPIANGDPFDPSWNRNRRCDVETIR